MAIEEDECPFKNTHTFSIFPTHLPLVSKHPQTIITSLLLGSALFYISTARSIKPLTTTIKVADGAFKGLKSLHKLHSPTSPSTIIFSVQALIKGYKISKHLGFLNSGKTTQTSCSCHLMTRFKASIGALNLVRYAGSLPIQNGFLGILNTVYKISSNSLKVLEGLMGIQIATAGSAFKKGFEGLGLIFKAVILTREFSQIAGLSVCRGAFETFRISSERRKSHERGQAPSSARFVRTVDSNIRTCLAFNGIRYCDLDRGCLGNFCLGFPFCYQMAMVGEECLELCVSDILCLSLPIHERIVLKM